MTDLLKRKREREKKNKDTKTFIKGCEKQTPPRNGSPRRQGPRGCPVSCLTIPTDSIPYTVLKGCGIRKVESNCSRAVYQHMYGTSSPISLHMEARFPHVMLEL